MEVFNKILGKILGPPPSWLPALVGPSSSALALVGPAENPLWPGQTSARRLFGTDLADFGTRPQQFACGHEASRRRERLTLELNN